MFLARMVRKYVTAKAATKRISLEDLHYGDKMFVKHYLAQATELPELIVLLDADKHHAAIKSLMAKFKAKSVKDLAQRMLESR